MKKKYTKKQITEAIAYWEKQLRTMNESVPQEYGFGPDSNVSDENDPVAKYTKKIRDFYGAEIVKSKGNIFVCELNSIEPDKNLSSKVPWNVAVTRWFVDLVLEFNSRNSANVSISKIDFTAPGIGATVQFSSKSYVNLAKFIHDAMCTDQYNGI